MIPWNTTGPELPMFLFLILFIMVSCCFPCLRKCLKKCGMSGKDEEDLCIDESLGNYFETLPED